MPDTHVTCPNCGYGFDGLRKSTRMFDCPSCDTTLFREGVELKPLGNHGEMHDWPMLFSLGDTVVVQGQRYTVVGHARYDYGRGTWDEMWVENGQGAGAWISVDEGDVVFQTAPSGNRGPLRDDPPPIGNTIEYGGRRYTVTEADSATLVAVRGEFPEVMQIGEAHQFINAAGPSGQLLSGEFWDGDSQWFDGMWMDPFDLQVLRADGGSAR